MRQSSHILTKRSSAKFVFLYLLTQEKGPKDFITSSNLPEVSSVGLSFFFFFFFRYILSVP